MLTGDKLETAENIGESCQLLKDRDEMKRVYVKRISHAKDCFSDQAVKENTARIRAGK